ncbi:uncharacterized protein CBL_00140 [Carabus blaptoides fortunei]
MNGSSTCQIVSDVSIATVLRFSKSVFYVVMGEQTERDGLFISGSNGYRVQNTALSESRAVRQSGWSFRLVTAAVATTIGASLPVGYNIGVVNAPADMIKVFCNESVYTRYDAVMSHAELDVLWSTIVSVFLVGGITGSLSGSWLADTVGRKGVYIISAVLHILGGVMFYACVPANSVEMLLLGRLLVGLAGGLITGIVPMYLTELSPVQLRGAMGVMCPLGLTFGVLVAQVAGLREILGTEETWPHLLSFFVILVAMCGLVTPILPESPKYLYVVRKQPQLALKELSKIRGLPISSLTDEVLDLQQAQRTDEQTGISWNIATVVKDKELLLPLLLVCAMQAGQQFSGINAVFYYSVSIFKTTGLNEQQSQLANIGCGSANLLMGIVSIFLMSHCNRRKLFLISCVTASIFLILLGLSIAFIESLFWMSYVSIVSILSFVLFYGLGLGPIPYFVGSELFEVGPRPSAMALGSMSNWGGNFIVGMTFPTLQSVIGPGAFGIFACITMALFFFVRKYLPETRGRDPSDIAVLCKHGLRSRPLDSASSSNTEEVTDMKSVN